MTLSILENCKVCQEGEVTWFCNIYFQIYHCITFLLLLQITTHVVASDNTNVLSEISGSKKPKRGWQGCIPLNALGMNQFSHLFWLPEATNFFGFCACITPTSITSPLSHLLPSLL